MELLYLWIENFRQIEQQGFSLSSKYLIATSKLDNRYEVTIEVNKAHVDLFPPNILGVTALAGKNGSGKSTIMHCLKLVYGQLGRLTSPLILVYANPDTKKIHTIYYQKGGIEQMIPLTVQVKQPGILDNGYEVLASNPYSISRHIGEHGKVTGLPFVYRELECAYLTNSFDRHKEVVYADIRNQSTTQKLSEYLDVYIKAKERAAEKKEEKIPTLEVGASHLDGYYRRELRRDVGFIQYANKALPELLPHLPTHLSISFNFDDYDYLTQNDGDTNLMLSSNHLKTIHHDVEQELNRLTEKVQIFQGLLILGAFYHALRNEMFEIPLDLLLEKLNPLRQAGSDKLEAIKWCITNLLPQEKSVKAQQFKQITSESVVHAFNNATLDKEDEHIKAFNHFPFKIDTKLWNLLAHVYDIRTKGDLSFIDISWHPQLSCGEEAILTHFARLYEIKKDISNKPLLLLIDEVELYFHPEWQKNYFNYLIKAVGAIFPDNQVQIILSTHSPFILSDLPKQNLVLLQKDINGKCVNADHTFQTETFGSNIHELFTNSFFLEDGLMGKFAQNYIHQLIQDIHSTDHISRENYITDFKNRIAIVGEQFFKTKLLELVAEKADFPLVNEILNDREDELTVLRQIRNAKSKQ